MAEIGGCPNGGGICIGCTMPGFPDKFMPFMNQPPGSLLSSAAVQTYGRAIHGAPEIHASVAEQRADLAGQKVEHAGNSRSYFSRFRKRTCQTISGDSFLHYLLLRNNSIKGRCEIGLKEGRWAYLEEFAKGSTFTARAFAAGLLSALGHSPTIAAPDLEGEILLNPEAMEQSSLRTVVRALSLTVTDDVREKDREEINHRMHQEVLESDSFPDIVYECSRLSASKTGEGQYWLAWNGELTLHGVKRAQPVSARVSEDGNTLRAMGDFALRQSDYKIDPVSALGGAVKLKDELKLSFNISARRQE